MTRIIKVSQDFFSVNVRFDRPTRVHIRYMGKNMVNVAKRFALMEDMRRDEMIKTLFKSLDIDQ